MNSKRVLRELPATIVCYFDPLHITLVTFNSHGHSFWLSALQSGKKDSVKDRRRYGVTIYSKGTQKIASNLSLLVEAV